MTTSFERTTAQHLADAFDAGVGSLSQLAILLTVRDLAATGATVTRIDLISVLAPMSRETVIKALEKLEKNNLLVRLPMKRDALWCRFRYALSERAAAIIDPII